MTAESRVDQHSIQSVDLGLPLGLRHEGPEVQVLWILHILMTKKQLINIKLQSNIYLIKTLNNGCCPMAISRILDLKSWYLRYFASTEVCKAFE